MSRLKHNYGQVANEVTRDPTISPIAKALYSVLVTYSDSAGFCYPGRKRLARELGVSVDTVRRALLELVRSGVVVRLDRTGENGRQTTSMTVLVEPARRKAQKDRGGAPVHRGGVHQSTAKNKTTLTRPGIKPPGEEKS